MITLALVGNPNSGKTTLFNQFTGNHQYVGNWPGVTVEKKEGSFKNNKETHIVDLPGIYSLSPYTKEEVVARNYLAEGTVDAIINIVDATNLERNLYLTTQLMEFGVPVVVALNQMDIVKKRGYVIKSEELSKQLGVPVVEISALTGEGVEECGKAAEEAAAGKKAPAPIRFSPELEGLLEKADTQLPAATTQALRRYYAIKAFEGDEKALAEISCTADCAALAAEAAAKFDDDPEGVVTDERYRYITSFIGKVQKRSIDGDTVSQKIDRVLTNRILALPIFVVIIGLVYYIAISTVGGVATDWANDGVFGDGWYLDPSPLVQVDGAQAALDEASGAYDEAQGFMAEFVAASSEAGVEGADTLQGVIDEDEALSAESAQEAGVDLATFAKAAEAAGVQATWTPEDEESGEILTDEAVTGGSAEFLEYSAVAEPNPSDYGIWIPGIPVIIENALDSIQCADWLKSLVLDGIVSGVGAVLGFVPQILILFFLLAILEGCGYMARVAFILDRIFRRFGLSGKTFIPMLIGTGCGIPAIMSTRTIESESARRLTIMTTTFMPCSAKLPIIALFAGAIFGGSGMVATAAYFVGIASIIISGIMLKKTKPFLGEETPFVMELPEYRVPRFVDLLRSMWERGWSFIKKAGTIILLSCILIWFLSSYGFENGTFGAVENMDNSILAAIGGAVCIVFAPLGWGDWQATASAITGLIAKENLVGTFGVLYGGGDGLWANLAAAYTVPAAASMMFFNLLCAPCFAAMGAIRREQGSAKWFWASVGYECLYAYAVALCIYQIGSAVSGAMNPIGLAVAVAIIAFALFMLFRPAPKTPVKAQAKPEEPTAEAA